ncbi:RES domain-containing protein [Flavobacterium sp. 1]|uniref:RES family NAD+ phosphorylase n=1 Tax=Flavobacterium sp. 1 TaxID=2035200 RepID=UPI000C2498D7|nr:RES family NAD+ phosphorylase [Flavobacterium sp. 1]PJJ10230.1 RES domain-containing protein [Flavobacterium sp. 1]
MEVCPNCFADKELKGYISSSTNLGLCKVCNSKNIPLLAIEELLDFFQELIDNYKPSADGEPLKSKIQSNWSFFSTHNVASIILNEVLPRITTGIQNSEDLVNYTEDIIENFSYWEKFKEKLKWSNRFISDIGYLEELGWDGFFNTQFELNSSDELFRARVHHKSNMAAYEAEEMMCPLSNLAGGGRANPLGIPYLYLSDNPETVLYEVRASYLDELSIGLFQLKKELSSVKIVDFTEDTSLFQPTNVNQTIKSKLLRDKISRDLSKPMRRYDSEIEYIPTQFICEFIRIFTGASGIRFSSSLHPTGKNIVMFDQELMECKQVFLRKINSMNLKAIEL